MSVILDIWMNIYFVKYSIECLFSKIKSNVYYKPMINFYEHYQMIE